MVSYIHNIFAINVTPLISILRYKLNNPLPDYAPFFEETEHKFKICNHLHRILEDDDNANINFDGAISKAPALLFVRIPMILTVGM